MKGTKEEAQATGYPLLSQAIAGGLFHPNCKHVTTTFFPGMRDDPGKVDAAKENPDGAAEQNNNQRQIQKQKRIAAGSLDKENVKTAEARQHQWELKDEKLVDRNPELKETSHNAPLYVFLSRSRID